MSQQNAVTNPEKRQDGFGQSPNATSLMPPVDVVEDNAGITLYADLPGVSKDKLELNVEGDTLSIEGTAAIPMPDSMHANYAEVNSSCYRRVFTLSKELDPNKISAELVQGVLKLRIPKAEHAQSRRIEVRG